MQTFMPAERPEDIGAAHNEEVQRWVTRDGGQTFVQIHGGTPQAVQFSGNGGVLGGKVRHNAESLLEAWLDIDEKYVMAPARNGLPIACWLSEAQPTHRVVWMPLQDKPNTTLVRVENQRAYGHIEWLNRAHPRCTPNWIYEKGRWWWVDSTGGLHTTPAGKHGNIQFQPLAP
jgi:hypothetical protein